MRIYRRHTSCAKGLTKPKSVDHRPNTQQPYRNHNTSRGSANPLRNLLSVERQVRLFFLFMSCEYEEKKKQKMKRRNPWQVLKTAQFIYCFLFYFFTFFLLQNSTASLKGKTKERTKNQTKQPLPSIKNCWIHVLFLFLFYFCCLIKKFKCFSKHDDEMKACEVLLVLNGAPIYHRGLHACMWVSPN